MICRCLVCLAVLLAPLAAAAAEPRLNEIQAIGSHNSYHVAPPRELLSIIGRLRKDAAAGWGFTQPPLPDQLDAGLRQFELDVYADLHGGLFANPLALKLAALSGAKPPPFDPDGELAKPGFKVLHVPDLDCWTNHRTLAGALKALSDWSRAHPRHLPVMVLIECKDQPHPPLPTQPLPFDRARLLELEREILSVIPARHILRPDEVRGDSPTLPEALRSRGWPPLSAVRGRFLLALDNTGALRDAYLQDNPALEGRLMFASADRESDPAAAWFKCNAAAHDFERIQRLVRNGFLVRTRADTSAANPALRDKAFASGAQWVSTDHHDAALPESRRVRFPGGSTVRPNPLAGDPQAAIDP